jgi:DNA (cytosine-5)-methyltransferase 1
MAPKVIDLFAGCGGLSLGLEQAGFEPVFVNELNPEALRSYLLNRSHLNLGETGNFSHDIKEITKTWETAQAFAKSIRAKHGEIDLVCGGPPCQGYSGIGHRRTFKLTKDEIPTNHLYLDMARVVEALAPRAFLFENVRGLLNARWEPTGEKGEIWSDVRAAFESLEVTVGRKKLSYRIGWRLVYAKDFGVPQNRPRVLMVGIREDIPVKMQEGQDLGFIPIGMSRPPDPIELLSDLVDADWRTLGESLKYLRKPQNEIQSALRESHGQRNFAKGNTLSEQQYSNHSDAVIKKFEIMLLGEELPISMKTKKFAQRVLPAKWPSTGPNITATSLPDDYVHYLQPRVLTVREWARLQMFPDWYEFSGKRTTGGRRRAGDPDAGDWTREVPKYTQIGNAVPVELARRVGLHLRSILGC